MEIAVELIERYSKSRMTIFEPIRVQLGTSLKIRRVHKDSRGVLLDNASLFYSSCFF